MKSEILAPCGSFDSLIAAVRCGANAVYLGGKNLNARRNAGNFDDTELEKAIKYCHARDVRVYLTLNTLVNDSEAETAIETIERACTFGADALILQDLGLASLVRKIAPDMPMHASTQMSVNTVSGVRLLEEIGFTRVVLPREMSLSEIKKIKSQTNIELEMFVHGALCMCVSGQCWMSAFIGSRSGNRGLCAQPCRLPFSCGEKGNSYDLSLKDLSLVGDLKRLEELGICSFKIEGRMKRPEYVAAAVTACKKALNNELDENLTSSLKNIFSRSGFTDGYYRSQLGKNMFGIRTKEDVTGAGNVLSSLQKLYEKEKPLYAVDFSLVCRTDEPATLTASANGKTVHVRSGESLAEAVNRATTKEELSDKLSKCGGTLFYANKLEIEMQDKLYIPASLINSLRRDALDRLYAEMSETKAKNYSHIQTEKSSYVSQTKKIYMRFLNPETIPENIKADKIFVPLSRILDTVGKSFDAELVAEIPRAIFGEEERIIKRLRQAKELGIRTVSVGTLDGLKIAKDEGFNIFCSVGTNIYNSEALLFYEELGAREALVSFELTLPKISALSGNIPRGLIAYGRVPLMLTRNCPVKNSKTCSECKGESSLTDRMGYKFPVDCSSGFSEILNSQPIYLGDKKDDIKNTDFVMLYFTKESKEEVLSVVKQFEYGEPFDKPFTRGLYYRGVK